MERDNANAANAANATDVYTGTPSYRSTSTPDEDVDVDVDVDEDLQDPSGESENEQEHEMEPDEGATGSNEWDQWVDSFQGDEQGTEHHSVHHDQNVPNLQAYMLAKEARQNAKKAFENALEESLQAMTQAMTEELLADTVGVVYQEQGERFEAYESTIIGTIKSNHGRRRHLMHQMERANANWATQYKKIRTAIWDGKDADADDHDTTMVSECCKVHCTAGQ